MKSLIPTLLTASLAANVAYGAMLLHRRFNTAPPAKIETSAATSARANEASVASVNEPSTSTHTGDPRLKDPAFVKTKLIADGYPTAVVDMVLAVTLDEKYRVYELSQALQRDRTPDLTQRLKDMNALAQGELRALTSTYQKLDQFRARDYAARYGDLPLATVEALRKIESEHRNETDRQFVTALRPLLTPGQIEDYARYNSLLARTIQMTINSIDVTEATYNALLQVAIARENSPTPDVTGAVLARNNSRPESVASYRRILGDEQFLRIIARFDSVSASADAVYQVAGLSPAARADLFIDVYQGRERYLQSGGAPAGLPAAARATYQRLIEKAALTPEQIEGFDRLLGSVLKRGEFPMPSGYSIASHSW